MAFFGYHEHFQFGWIFPRAFGLLLIVSGNDNTLIALKNYVKITFRDCQIFKKKLKKKINSRNKTNTTCHENQSDMCQYFNSSGFPLKFRSLNLKCVFCQFGLLLKKMPVTISCHQYEARAENTMSCSEPLSQVIGFNQ